MAGQTEWSNGGNGVNGRRTEWSNGGNGRIAEMATYVLFTVHTDDTDTNDNDDDDDDTLIFYSIDTKLQFVNLKQSEMSKKSVKM